MSRLSEEGETLETEEGHVYVPILRGIAEPGSLDQLRELARIQLPGGESEPGARRFGVLVWYRKGSPIYPCFAALQEERALAGDWGPPAVPAELVFPLRGPEPRAYALTHKRLGPLLRSWEYCGPLMVWMRLGLHPVFERLEVDLEAPHLHASLELLEDGFVGRWLAFVGGQNDLPPPGFRTAWAAAARVSLHPWPAGARIYRKIAGASEARGFWPLATRWINGSLFATGTDVGDVVGISRGHPLGAVGEARRRARLLRLDNAQIREDMLRWCPSELKRLRRRKIT